MKKFALLMLLSVSSVCLGMDDKKTATQKTCLSFTTSGGMQYSWA